jgi:hypothetical protein
MTSALPIIGITASLASSSGLILLCLVAFGSLYRFMQLITLDTVGSLPEAEPHW